MDYLNGKIYTIRSFQTDKYYIGSTTQSLSKRLSGHKSSYKDGRPVSSSEIVKYDDAYIELLEDYPCSSKNELNKREGQLIRQYKNECVNLVVPCRTRNEYYNECKQEILALKKETYLKNKKAILDYQKQYYQQNKIKKLE